MVDILMSFVSWINAFWDLEIVPGIQSGWLAIALLVLVFIRLIIQVLAFGSPHRPGDS